MGLLDRLGIAAEIKPKLIGSPPGAGGLVSPVVKGEAEMVVGTMSAIMEPGVDPVGPIPNELQNWATFTGGVGAASKEAAAAQATDPLSDGTGRGCSDQGQGDGAAGEVTVLSVGRPSPKSRRRATA